MFKWRHSVLSVQHSSDVYNIMNMNVIIVINKLLVLTITFSIHHKGKYTYYYAITMNQNQNESLRGTQMFLISNCYFPTATVDRWYNFGIHSLLLFYRQQFGSKHIG